MDNLPNSQLPPEPSVQFVQHNFSQTNKGKIAAAVLGITVLLITLAALNYFRVINLSQQLKFLPTIYIQTTDPAILRKAKEDMGVFMKENFQPTLIPQSYLVVSPQDSKGSILDPRQFNTFFKINEVNVSVSIRYTTKNGKRVPENINASFIVPQLTQSLATPSAAQITSQYFSIQPKGLWECDEINLRDQAGRKATLCENFWTDENQIKKGIGVMSPVPNEQKTEVFLCEIKPESVIYNWKSCSLYKAT